MRSFVRVLASIQKVNLAVWVRTDMREGFHVLETMVILAFKVYRNDNYGKASIHFAGAEKGRYGEYHTAVGTNAGFRRDNPEGP
ncbi:hypothetical protein GCM10007423_47920 [Dyadobacter endophyticus]|uniref:Uncharacterized protein n=1 Tax=Dyadobacter endophyticus TaxID=1749036 RepID=A0ABQ1Z566_9BACT|nr:hypothetical protein GCM10007423_47920 [Dyadobacter endophyticus]